jgi:HlyD family secretion protein
MDLEMKIVRMIASLLLSLLVFSCGGENDGRLEYSGTIESTDYIISSQSQGMIKTLLHDKGDFVKKDDTLAIINHEKLDLQLLQLSAARKGLLIQLKMLKEGARSEDKKLANEALSQAEASYYIAESNKKRMDNLFQQESITKKQYDEAKLAYEVAQSKYISAKQNVLKTKSSRPEQIEQLNANIEQTDASILLLKKNINDCYIVSPIDGQIINKFIEKSEVVSFLSSLFKVVDLRKSELTIYVPEVDLAFINIGQSVDVYIDAYTDKSFSGIITYISPEAEFTPKNIQTKDERTKLVFAVTVKIDNPDRILKSGMPADAVVELKD